MSWQGKWNGKTFEGSFEFPDGAKFTGTATLCDVHRVEVKVADGYSKVSEHPCEPYWEFAGTWESKDGAGYPLIKPPPPEKDMGHHQD